MFVYIVHFLTLAVFVNLSSNEKVSFKKNSFEYGSEQLDKLNINRYVFSKLRLIKLFKLKLKTLAKDTYVISENARMLIVVLLILSRQPHILKLYLECGLATLRQRPAESAVQ